MNSAQTKKIKWSLFALLVTIWIFPLLRWAHTLTQVMQIDSEVHSVNSNNDVVWNYIIGFGYLLCLVAAFAAIVWLKPARPSSWLGVLSAVLAAAFYCRFPFDGMVIIAPTVNPQIPIFTGLGCLLCTGISWAFSHRTPAKFSSQLSTPS